MQWTIEQLDCYPTSEGEIDVVVRAHWILTDTQDGLTGKVYGATVVTLDPNEPFIPYDQLTEAQVVAWVKEGLRAEQVAEYETAVQRQIDAQKNPPIVTPPLPW